VGRCRNGRGRGIRTQRRLGSPGRPGPLSDSFSPVAIRPNLYH